MKTSPPTTELETLRIQIHGHVQGVGYRLAAVRRAHMLGVRGWIQNLEDGSVEAMIQGSPDQVDAMLSWMRVGPARARVRELQFKESDTDRRFDFFQQL